MSVRAIVCLLLLSCCPRVSFAGTVTGEPVPQRVLILVYHRFAAQRLDSMTVRTGTFLDQLHAIEASFDRRGARGGAWRTVDLPHAALRRSRNNVHGIFASRGVHWRFGQTAVGRVPGGSRMRRGDTGGGPRRGSAEGSRACCWHLRVSPAGPEPSQ